MFTDVEGSTRLRTRLGDAVAGELLRTHDGIVRESVTRFGGHRIEDLGDGFLLTFDSSHDAIACAVSMQRALDDVARRDPNGGLRVRIGMCRGEVDEEDGKLRGTAVHAAARVMAKAVGGQVLIPADLTSDAEAVDGASLLDRGLFWLKGFPERWRLYEVVWQPEGAAPRAQPDRTPYVGRETERADLLQHLEEAQAGRGSLVLIGGEPGVGKTRLAEEVVLQAEAAGMRALVGHCSEAEGSSPYEAWAEALGAALAAATDAEAFREILGDAASEVARIVPELRRIYPDIPPPLELPPEQERRYLFNSVRELVGRAASAEPLLLLLDDLQWADEPSLLLLQHVAVELAGVPVMILGTYRDEAAEGDTPFSRNLADMLRKRLARRIPLDRLPADDVAAMVEVLAERPPPAALVRLLYDETEGNPFFVEEVFQHLLEEGRLLDSEGRWRDDLTLGETDAPHTVRLVIGRRLERLSDPTRAALAMAAVVGRFFELDLVARASQSDEDHVLDALEQAERARLIRLEDGPEARFAFVHELIRQTLLAALPDLRRQRAHLRVAAAMEERAAGREEDVASDIAHHLSQGGGAADATKLRRYLVLAGKQALRSSAFESAIEYLDAANGLSWDDDPRGWADLMYQRGLAFRTTRRWNETIAAWNEAVEGFGRLDDREAVGRVCREAAYQLGWAGRWEDALMMVGQGLQALEGMVNAEQGHLLAMAGIMFASSGYHEAGTSMLADAHRVAAELGDEEVRGTALAFDVFQCFEYMQMDELVRTGREAAEVLTRSGARWQLSEVLGFILQALVYLGRWDEAREMAEGNETLATRLGNPQAQLVTLRARMTLDVGASGDLDELERFAREDLELCGTAGLPFEAESHVYLSIVELLRGRWDRSLEHAEDAFRIEPPGTAMTGWERTQLVRVLAHMGERDRALQLLDQGVLPIPGQVNSIGSWVTMQGAVEALWMLGEKERCGRLYPLIEEMLRMGIAVNGVTLRVTEGVAGLAAAAGGDRERAEEHFERAIALTNALPYVLERPEIRRFWSEALLEWGEPGDGERARKLLEDAAEEYRTFGMPRHVEMVRGLLG